MNWQVPETVTFEEAIKLTQSLMAGLKEGQLSEPEIEGIVTSLVQGEQGARGFFVTYLTEESAWPDFPSLGIILALQSAPEVVSQLLVKNLAMSTAMAITHRRNCAAEMAKNSQKVQQRTANLIQKLQLEKVAEKLHQLHQSIIIGEGEYQAFLEKWKYDEEQKQAIAQIISEVLT